MVLRIGFQIINVNIGKSRDEQLQLLFVEDADQAFGDDVIESFEEGIQLLADGTRHLHLADQADVFHLVFLRYDYTAAVGLQFARFRDTKLLHLGRECQIVAQLRHFMFDEEGQTLRRIEKYRTFRKIRGMKENQHLFYTRYT